MKIALRITVEIDPDEWAAEYGVDRTEVRADVRSYIANAIYSMPLEPQRVTVRPN